MSKVITQKTFKMNTIHIVLAQAWARYDTVNISETAPGILIFDFEREEDRCKILDISPWAINGHVLSIKRWEPSIGVNDVDFNKVLFWVQIHETLSTENAWIIGNEIGMCVEIELNVEATKRSYLRMKVEIDVNVPLMVGFWWTNSQGTERWASIKYERLSDLCYECDTLGHTTQTCKEDVKNKPTSSDVWTMVGGDETETYGIQTNVV